MACIARQFQQWLGARRRMGHAARHTQNQAPCHKDQHRHAHNDMRPSAKCDGSGAGLFDLPPQVRHSIAENQVEQDQQGNGPVQKDLDA